MGKINRKIIASVALATLIAGASVASGPAYASSTTICAGLKTATQKNIPSCLAYDKAHSVDFVHAWDSNLSFNAGHDSTYNFAFWKQVWGHNCTNYVAFAEYSLRNVGTSTQGPAGDEAAVKKNKVANANAWGFRYQTLPVSAQPAPGDIAWWKNNFSGHVAYVEQVLDSGKTIIISEDNYTDGTAKNSLGPDRFAVRKISTKDAEWPTGFIRFAKNQK